MTSLIESGLAQLRLNLQRQMTMCLYMLATSQRHCAITEATHTHMHSTHKKMLNQRTRERRYFSIQNNNALSRDYTNPTLSKGRFFSADMLSRWHDVVIKWPKETQEGTWDMVESRGSWGLGGKKLKRLQLFRSSETRSSHKSMLWASSEHYIKGATVDNLDWPIHWPCERSWLYQVAPMCHSVQKETNALQHDMAQYKNTVPSVHTTWGGTLLMKVP